MKYGKAYGGADPEMIEGGIFRIIVKVPDFDKAGGRSDPNLRMKPSRGPSGRPGRPESSGHSIQDRCQRRIWSASSGPTQNTPPSASPAPATPGAARKERENTRTSPGRHLGAEAVEDDGEPFEEKMARLTARLHEQFKESERLEKTIKKNLKAFGL